MPTLSISIFLPTGARIPGELSTDHPSSSYGKPVLLIEGQPYGLGDSFDPGWEDPILVAETAVEGEDPDDTGLLEVWRGMCGDYLARGQNGGAS